ncbi:MAG TPA: ATP-binding cassette domain-containing protein [Kofleriaceae bacterium]|nr:ATP-binding cassette domain-containing protein [Kofleriaceae bacterium]
MSAAGGIALEVRASKRYGDCVALADAHLIVRAGTVHAVVGENGAGKSTLLKVVYGLVRPDRGTLALDGRSIDLARHGVVAAQAMGVGMVHQHGMLVPTLTFAENAALGHEPTSVGMLDLGAAERALEGAATRLEQPLDGGARAGALTVGEQQRAEIVMVVARAKKVLILDEPTALLAPREVARLLAMLRTIADGGCAVVLVSHKLDEIAAVADAVTVLRAGATVGELPRGTRTPDIARAMVGGEPPPPGAAPPPPPVSAPVVLAATLPGVSIAVRAGEVVGIAGVEGNGQRELIHALVGLAPAARGTVTLGDRDVTRASVGARRDAGLAHLAEDRHLHGLVLDGTLAENLMLGREAEVRRGWRVDPEKVRVLAERSLAALDVRPPQPELLARSLSGGNQQKLVVARELGRPGVRAVVAAQPTRGVDIAAQAVIHDRLRAAAADGAAVLVVSADLDELFALCHRVAVMHRGAIAGELAGDALRATDARERLGAWMVGA